MAVVIWGVGQLGGAFAHGALRAGHTVVPLRRSDSPDAVAAEVPEPRLVVVAVGERDLDSVLASCPRTWRDRLLLVQNELLPSAYRRHDLRPTVAVVWFEKKKQTALHPIVSTPVAGSQADQVVDLLSEIDMPAHVVSEAQIVEEMVLKNLYILVANLGGLAVGGGTVGALIEQHREIVDSLCREVLYVQEALVGQKLDRRALREGLSRTFAADPQHKAMGRTAPERLARFLVAADEQEIDAPFARSITI